MKNRLIFVAGVVIAILVAGFLYNKYRVAPKVKFETLELTDLDGVKISPDVLRHKKILVNFFATWCGPCVREIPSLESVQTYFSKENFKVVLISDEPVERLKEFKQATNISLIILHSEKKLREYKIETIPASYFLNEKGEIIFKTLGEENWASEKMLQKLSKP